MEGIEGEKSKPPMPAWLLVFFSNMFFGCAGFSIVLPTLWPYLREMNASTRFLAAVIAAYSVGEGCGGWLSGCLYSRFPRQPKLLLQGGMALGVLSAFFYAIARNLGPAAPYIVLIARFFSGFDNGTRQTIEQTFVATKIPPQHQTTCSLRLASCAITGIMMGPALGAPLQAINMQIWGFGIDGNNSPGLVLLVVCISNLLVTSCFFNVTGRSYSTQASAYDTDFEKPNMKGLIVCYMVFFGVNLNMASLETITPVVAQRLYGWGPCLDPSTCSFNISQTYTNALLTAGGLLSLAMGVLMSFCGGKIYKREIWAISWSLLVSVAINVGNMDLGGHLPAIRFVSDYLLGVDRMLRLTKQLQMVDADTSRINDNTLHLAVSLLYDFTSLQTKLDPELAEIACTKLAESMSEVSNEYYKRERCESFARTPIASQGRWSREDILRAESVVFQRLQARLHRPTAAWFLHSSLAVGECDTQVRNLAQYINTLGLYDPNMQDQPAALRAQVSLLLAVYAASRNSLPSQTSCRECMETSCWNQVRTATCWSNSKETVMPVFTRMCHLLTTERFRLEAQGLTAVVDQRYSAVARSLPTRFPSELANELLLPSLQHCLQ